MTLSLDTRPDAIQKEMGIKPFTFEVELQSCYKEPDGTPHVIGVASDDMEDRTGDRMSDKAVTRMARQCNQHDLPLLDNHRSTFGFGHTHSAQARRVPFTTKDGKQKVKTELVVDFALDTRFPQSDVLFQEVKAKKSKKQLSIGGFLNTSNPKAVRFEENEKGQTIRVIEDIELEHIAATRPNMAAVPRTKFVDAIVKDVFGDEQDAHKSPHQTERSGRFHGAQQLGSGLPPSSQAVQEKTMTTETTVDPKTEKKTEAAVDDGKKTEKTPEIDPKEMEEAKAGVKMLATIGKMFGKKTEPSEKASEEVTELATAAEKAIKVAMTEKDYDTVRRVQSALTRLLQTEGVAGADPAATVTTPTQPAAAVGVLDEAKLASMIADALAPLLEGQTALAKTFTDFGTDLVTELSKGLENLGQGFKDFVKTEIAQVEARVQDVTKEADSRLGVLEKVSGTSKRLTGSEGNLATGDPRPAIEKTGRTSCKPDESNPWRGIFDAGLDPQTRRRLRA